MTTPVSDLQVVLAKFAAAMVFYVVMWLPLLPCLLIVRHYTHDSAAFDPGTIGSTYLGILLLGSLFISLGCCASAITRSQGIAAMISLCFGVSVYMLAWFVNGLPVTRAWQGQALACFDFFEQMHDFVRGVVDTRPVVLLGSLSLFFLFLALRVVESRRWK